MSFDSAERLSAACSSMSPPGGSDLLRFSGRRVEWSSVAQTPAVAASSAVCIPKLAAQRAEDGRRSMNAPESGAKTHPQPTAPHRRSLPKSPSGSPARTSAALAAPSASDDAPAPSASDATSNTIRRSSMTPLVSPMSTIVTGWCVSV